MRNASIAFMWILVMIFAAWSVTLEQAVGERSLFEEGDSAIGERSSARRLAHESLGRRKLT